MLQLRKRPLKRFTVTLSTGHMVEGRGQLSAEDVSRVYATIGRAFEQESAERSTRFPSRHSIMISRAICAVYFRETMPSVLSADDWGLLGQMAWPIVFPDSAIPSTTGTLWLPTRFRHPSAQPRA